MRSLALSLALIARGLPCVFAVPPAGRAALERFSPLALPVLDLPAFDDMGARAKALATAAHDVAAATLVLDGYGWDAGMETDLVAHGAMLVVLDDLADRPHLADVLIDSGPGRTAKDYAHLTPATCALLVGTHYALLRPEFVSPAKPTRDRVERILVCFGLSDLGGIAGRAVRVLSPHCGEARIDVAIASDARSLPELQRLARDHGRITLYEDATDMAGLMRQADLAVGAGGSMIWERCSLGLPSIAVVVAENQRHAIDVLAAEGVLIAIDGADPLLDDRLLEALAALQAPEVRGRLALASKAVCDGAGARRAAQVIAAKLSRRHPG